MASPNIRSQADSENMDADVSASDETELGRCLPSHVYPKEIRARAIELFKKGAGYKRTSSVLGIKPSIVRDIGRLSEHTGVPSGVCRRIVARCEREDEIERSKVLG